MDEIKGRHPFGKGKRLSVLFTVHLEGPEGVKYTVCTKSTPTVIFTVTLNVANRIPSNLAHSVGDT